MRPTDDGRLGGSRFLCIPIVAATIFVACAPSAIVCTAYLVGQAILSLDAAAFPTVLRKADTLWSQAKPRSTVHD